ncbi:MAG: hypothetical protein AB7I59_03590 [Geminicoccaceae bacterium]
MAIELSLWESVEGSTNSALREACFAKYSEGNVGLLTEAMPEELHSPPPV